MAIEEFLDYAISVSGTLDEIHKKGNIHGDIRPENIRSEPDSLKAE